MNKTPDIKNFVSKKINATHLSINENYLKISIVIPSFNQSKYIERTLLSVINQDYKNFELIIIDGSSTDNTVNVIKKYNKHISYWISEKDRGQSHALNKGFSKASGDIYGWLNSDDIYLPGTFNKVCSYMKKNLSYNIIYGNWYTIDSQDKITDLTYSLPPRKPNFPTENMNAYNQALFWRKKVHKNFKDFDENLHHAIDNDMIIRFIKNEGTEKFIKINDFLGAFRVYQGQKTNEMGIDDVDIKERDYLEKKFSFYKKRSIPGIYFRIKYIAYQFIFSLFKGGVIYTYKKLIAGLKRKKRLQ